MLLSISLLATLIGCNKTDYSKPHEYIKAAGYGESWVSTEENNYTLHLTDKNGEFILKSTKNYFDLGSGRCEEYLKGLDAEWAYQIMVATNALIHSEFEGRHDIPIRYAKLQCVAYHGQDQACEAKRTDLSSKIDANIGREDATAFFLRTMGDCDIRKEVGPARTFSLDDSKKYRYVPK